MEAIAIAIAKCTVSCALEIPELRMLVTKGEVLVMSGYRSQYGGWNLYDQHTSFHQRRDDVLLEELRAVREQNDKLERLMEMMETGT